MSRRWAALALLAVAGLMLAAGCGTRADERILEELGMITTIGYDHPDDEEGDGADQKRTTVIFPVINPQASVEEETLSVVGSSNDAREDLSRMTDRKLVFGQLRTVIFHIRIAESGLMDDLDTLLRDPTVGTRVKLALTAGNTKDLLSIKSPVIPRMGQYIDMLLEKEMVHHFIPRVNVHTFFRDMMDDGIEPVMPILKTDGKVVELEGIGLFREDRLVGRVEPRLMAAFMMLHENFHQGTLILVLEEGESVTLGSLRCHRKVRVSRPSPGGPPVAHIRLSLLGSLAEYTGDKNLRDGKVRADLIKRINRKLEQRCRAQIRQLQSLGADSIGIGQKARNLYKYADWKKLNWPETFAGMDIRVSVGVTIKDYGAYP